MLVMVRDNLEIFAELVEWAIHYEIMYYSPFFVLIAVMVLVSCCHTCVGGLR